MPLSLFDRDPDVGRHAAIEQLHDRTALYTADPIVDELLDRIGWPAPGKRLLDPGAGDGAFLLRALARLDLSDRQAVLSVQGWEIHPVAVRHARDRVSSLLIETGWPFDEASAAAMTIVREGDFLTASLQQEQFDFIAGNPPYLRYAHLPELFQKVIDEAVSSWARADILHAFLDRCVSLLAPEGVIGAVTADRWLINTSTADLRARIGTVLGVHHCARLDSASAFHRPKYRRAGQPPRVHAVAIVLSRHAASNVSLSRDPHPIDPLPEVDPRAPTLEKVAHVRIAPWLGPDGIFVIDAASAPNFPDAHLIPIVDTPDMKLASGGVVRPSGRLAIVTTADQEPSEEVVRHLDEHRSRMPERGKRPISWLPPETINLDLAQGGLLVPRIAPSLRAFEIAPGSLPINHNISVITLRGGVTLARLRDEITSPFAQAWIRASARRLENNYLDIQTTTLRRLPLPGLVGMFAHGEA